MSGRTTTTFHKRKQCRVQSIAVSTIGDSVK